MTDEQTRTLWTIGAHLDKHSNDVYTRLILADLLSELGDPLEVVQRYIVSANRYPMFFVVDWDETSPPTTFWVWGHETVALGVDVTTRQNWVWRFSCLEDDLWALLAGSTAYGGPSDRWKYYYSRKEAEMDLLEVLRKKHPELFTGGGCWQQPLGD